MVSWFSKLVVATTVRMPRWFVRWVSRRYVAGDSLEDAVAVMKRLSGEGACFTVDVLGEEISSMDEAAFFLEAYIRVMRAIKEHGFD
ncbi:MAG TPA: proline dehydrogenase, partial [Candidatus Poseidoniales archaeon]